MADFGKLNFSVSFNPTSAFPLDARCYFESLKEAEAAAATAKSVGDSTTVYYYGQKLLVVENGVATWYTIQPDNTLLAEGTGSGTVVGDIKIGNGLKRTADGTIEVDTATAAEADNTKPITSAAVATQLGNIEVLLKTI